MHHPNNHIFAHTPETLESWCQSHTMPPFRAAQILEWVYTQGIIDPHNMSNLSKLDRETLAREMTFDSGQTLTHQIATDGTQKLLLQWNDYQTPSQHTTTTTLPILGESPSDTSRQTECVMIPTEKRRTACISSQVGCPVGCTFCASGIGGLDGNLSAGRIIEQVWKLSNLPGIDRITNVVFMGMGEPLANFAAVKHAIQTIAAPWGMGISARKITVSTVGLPQAIEKLAREVSLPVTLALSLHAPNDALRRSLIPWSHYTTIAELLASCQAWFDKTGREITLEYILLRDVNDRPEHAKQLAQLCAKMRANVNLIRYNEVDALPYQRPRDLDVQSFRNTLHNAGVNVHIRSSRGRDIAAACGQLRHEGTRSENSPSR